jgi:hypothetical protein
MPAPPFCTLGNRLNVLFGMDSLELGGFGKGELSSLIQFDPGIRLFQTSHDAFQPGRALGMLARFVPEKNVVVELDRHW